MEVFMANNNSFITNVSTGIFDPHITNLEISLPYCFYLYTKDKPFHISFSGRVITIAKGEGIFIKKSTPFSVLLNWGALENGLARNDIVSIQIPQAAIIEYSRNNLCHDLLKQKKWAVNDYLLFDYLSEYKNDLMIIDVLIASFPVSSSGEILYDCVSEAKYLLMLSIFRKQNPELDYLAMTCTTLSTSEKVADLIMNDYSKNWKSEELAKQMNMSVSTFKKKMYKDIGSVSNYITKLKMIEALRQLRRTNQPICSIANSLGYTSSSYFTSVFKKYFDVFPSDIRRNDYNEPA